MNILFLANHLNTGGITSYLLTLTRGFVDAGHEVRAITGPGNCVTEFRSAGGKHQEFGFRVKSDADPRIYFSLPHADELKRSGIDVVHSNTRATQIMGERYAKYLGAVHVSTCHGFFKTRIWRKIYPCWGKRVVAISRPVVEHLIKDFRVEPTRVVLVPNGIDLSRFVIPRQEDRDAARRKFGVQGTPVIGIIARLSDVKGHSDLIKAFKQVLLKFPESRLLIVGEGPQEDDLRRLVEGLQLTRRVDFYKIVNRTADVLPLFDVFVMPSLQEGLGLSVLEAQAMGLPVVASRVGGLPDIIEHNRTGILVEPRNPAALAEAICGVLDHPAKAWDIGRAARMFVEKHYSSGQMVSSTLAMYKEVRAS
jgi:glycosyltransferase involved in cell wall biosynthesis